MPGFLCWLPVCIYPKRKCDNDCHKSNKRHKLKNLRSTPLLTYVTKALR